MLNRLPRAAAAMQAAAKKAAYGLAASAAVLATLGATHHATDHTAPTAAVSPVTAQVDHLTTTFHHPFYDETQAAFVEAQDLHPGDTLQTPTGTAQITTVRLYHANTTTYDLTIGDLHTYYVEAGDTPVLVHNCGDVDYGEVLSDGRRTGVTAIVTPADLGTGTKAGRRILPPGFVKNTIGHTRGHLLPQSLGGDGKVPANIVKTASKVDNGAMAAFGDSIAVHVGEGNTVLFAATPRYLEGSNVPFRIDIHAFDDNGWSTAAQFRVG